KAFSDHCGAVLTIASNSNALAKLQTDQKQAESKCVYLFFDDESKKTRRKDRLFQPDGDGQTLADVPDDETPAEPCNLDSMTTILYTSGTTGAPKGVMLSQRNLLSNIQSILAVLPLYTTDVRVGFLPLSHIFARTCDLYTWLASGCQLVLARSMASVFEDIQNSHPTYLNGVPYFYEKFFRQAQQEGRIEDPGWLRQQLGGQIRICNCGGAPLPDHVQRWYDSQGVTLITGYGLTETSPVLTSSAPSQMKLGAVGRVAPGIEIRLAEDNEVLARGQNVMMGYYQDEEGTRAVFDGDWFRTGDTGVLDADGFLTLTGRKKELIVTNGGKNIDPSLIEHRLLSSSKIHQCMVVGDRRDFLAALIVPEASFEDDEPSQWRTLAERQLHDLSRYEQIGCVVIVSEPFSLANDQLTVKGSLRRQKIEQDYSDSIEASYQKARRERIRR
ncbi:MAG: AMP-binding protein, partial [Planctomycetota bacterium]|nr:AMP-binding protein [Planctomycetota bacterium]